MSSDNYFEVHPDPTIEHPTQVVVVMGFMSDDHQEWELVPRGNSPRFLGVTEAVEWIENFEHPLEYGYRIHPDLR